MPSGSVLPPNPAYRSGAPRAVDPQRTEREALDSAGRPAHAYRARRPRPVRSVVLHRETPAEVGDAAYRAGIDHHARRHLPAIAQGQRGGGERVVLLDAEREGAAGAGVAELRRLVQRTAGDSWSSSTTKRLSTSMPMEASLSPGQRRRLDHQFLVGQVQARDSARRHAGTQIGGEERLPPDRRCGRRTSAGHRLPQPWRHR